MKMRSFAPPILEAWATWETLRKLGFAASDIFWEFSNTLNAVPRPGMALNIVLRTQDRAFSVTCSPRLSDGEARRMQRESEKFQAALIAGEFDESEMTELLAASWVWQNKSDMLVGLVAKGFAFPCKMN